MKYWVNLDNWIEIKVSGSETMKYLNGIITKDLLKIDTGKFVRAAFLTPNAKIRSVFWLKKANTNLIYFYCHPRMKDELIEDLLKYKLSMDVKLEDITEETPPLYLVSSDEKIPGLSSEKFGFTFVHSEDEPKGRELSDKEFRDFLIEEGVAPLQIMPGENPYELGIDDIITLEKGCFLGQEPISRMYHRGNPRKYVYHLEIPSTSASVITDTEGNEVGEILMTSDNLGIAFIRRTVKDLENLTIDGEIVKIKDRIGTYPSNDRN